MSRMIIDGYIDRLLECEDADKIKGIYLDTRKLKEENIVRLIINVCSGYELTGLYREINEMEFEDNSDILVISTQEENIKGSYEKMFEVKNY